MSSQPPHASLMIPGPIEFDDAVLQAMSHFRYVFRPSLSPMKKVFKEKKNSWDLSVRATSGPAW